MSKNYSEQELRNVISDNIKFISDDVASITANDVKEYFANAEENQDVESDVLQEDAASAISTRWHEIANEDAEIERILVGIKDQQ